MLLKTDLNSYLKNFISERNPSTTKIEIINAAGIEINGNNEEN